MAVLTSVDVDRFICAKQKSGCVHCLERRNTGSALGERKKAAVFVGEDLRKEISYKIRETGKHSAPVLGCRQLSGDLEVHRTRGAIDRPLTHVLRGLNKKYTRRVYTSPISSIFLFLFSSLVFHSFPPSPVFPPLKRIKRINDRRGGGGGGGGGREGA